MAKGSHESFDFTGADGTPVAAYAWRGAAAPRAIVQIAHGMGEHALRYEQVAGELVGAGYVVVANDHRGHGRTAPDASALGEFGPGGFATVVADMAALSRLARQRFPGLPLVLLGHSMGSMAAQDYIHKHSDLIDALVLSGSTALDVAWPELSKQVASGFSLNAAFEPGRTDFDWLSRDEAQVDAYVADLLCGFTVTESSMGSMVEIVAKAADPERIAAISGRFPIYILAGDRDPVTGNLEWLRVLEARYRAANIGPVSTDYYRDGRHEMFNETNRDEVVANLIAWLDRALPAAQR